MRTMPRQTLSILSTLLGRRKLSLGITGKRLNNHNFSAMHKWSRLFEQDRTGWNQDVLKHITCAVLKYPLNATHQPFPHACPVTSGVALVMLPAAWYYVRRFHNWKSSMLGKWGAKAASKLWYVRNLRHARSFPHGTSGTKLSPSNDPSLKCSNNKLNKLGSSSKKMHPSTISSFCTVQGPPNLAANDDPSCHKSVDLKVSITTPLTFNRTMLVSPGSFRNRFMNSTSPWVALHSPVSKRSCWEKRWQ